MTYSVPTHGEPNWDGKINPSLQYLKDTAEAAETPTGAQAKATAAQNTAISAAATDAQTKADAAQSAAISAAATDATTKANSVQSSLNTHVGNVANPHSVTKAQVGLGSVPNVDATSRANHTGTQTASTISDLDSGVAAYINNSTSATASAIAPVGSGVSRFVGRANAGAALKIVGVGDSILYGAGATIGTDDTLTVLKNTLATRFPSATLTLSNRAVSGATTALFAIGGALDNAITDAGDLYVIGFGRNDVQADAYPAGTPVQGYRRDRSLRYLEVILRIIRSEAPQADIVLMTENPITDYSADGNMRTYQQGVRELAQTYGAEFADTYGAWGTSGYSGYLYDGTHPNPSGHALHASTIAARIPATLPAHVVGLARPTLPKGVRTPEGVDTRFGFHGWSVLNGNMFPAPADVGATYTQTGAGWTSTYPRETSTANDYFEITFTGTDFGIRVDNSATAAPVVDIAIDGVTTLTNQSMYVIPSTFQLWQFFATNMTDTTHTIRITLKTGTLRWYQMAWLRGAAQNPVVAGSPGGLRTMVTGRYYAQQRGSTSAITIMAAGDAYVVPLWIPETRNFDRIAVSCTTAAASSTATLGIYRATSTDQPGARILTTSALDTSTTGWKEGTISTRLEAGWYWVSILALGGAPRFLGSDLSHPLVASAAQTFGSSPLNGYIATAQASLPATWSATAAAVVSPMIALRPA